MADTAAKVVVGLFVAGIMAAFLLPVAIGAVVSPDDIAVSQDVDETITLEGDLNLTLDDSTADTDSTYTVENDAASETVTIDEGENDTVTVDGNDVTISVTDSGDSSATSDVEYPKTYGWTDGAASLWLVLPVLMVLAIFIYFTGMAVNRM